MKNDEIINNEKISQKKLENQILKIKQLQNCFYVNKALLEKDNDIANKFFMTTENQKDLKESVIYKVKKSKRNFKPIIIIFILFIIYLLFHHLFNRKLYSINFDILNDKTILNIFNAYINFIYANPINFNDNKLLTNLNIIEKKK